MSNIFHSRLFQYHQNSTYCQSNVCYVFLQKTKAELTCSIETCRYRIQECILRGQKALSRWHRLDFSLGWARKARKREFDLWNKSETEMRSEKEDDKVNDEVLGLLYSKGKGE